MRRRIGCVGVLLLAAVVAGSVPEARQQAPRATFRAGLTLVSVDLVVRDKDGNIVRGLTEKDFEIREDGRVQDVQTFSFQEIQVGAAPVRATDLLAGIEARVAEQALLPAAAAAAARTQVEPVPMRSEDLAGRRLIVLLFDVSSMEPEDVQRSVESAQKYVQEQMSESDLIAVATVSSVLNVVTDFTGDRVQVEAALNTLSWTEGTAVAPVDASTAATDEAAAAEEETSEETTELDLFNNDVRLRVLKTLADALAPIEQKKAIVYFSAGMERNGSDNQVELRAAINAAVRGNVSIYSIDTRGLQAVVPGGDATQASGRGRGLFSGRGMARQFSRLASSQGTLVSLSADTGGRAFTDSNNFGEAFTRLQNDMSAYYLLGYVSTNTSRDGRFRRIQVRPKNGDYRIEARAGYYAERDFAHTAKTDRETLLTEQLYTDIPLTDVPVLAKAGYFRMEKDKYYVPVSVAVPGSVLRVPPGKDEVEIDILGEVRDERGFPVGRLRQTMKMPAGSADTLAGKQVLYQSGMTLPPGRFSIKVVVRENTDGMMGAFEAPISVPDLNTLPLKVSSVVLSTQLQAVPETKGDNPLVREGVQLLPNLTHVVGRDQKLFFYYEVYDPTLGTDQQANLRTSLAFYQGKVKVLETPVIVRRTVDVDKRKAALFQLEIAAGRFAPGLYTCQVNIIDEVAGNFAFPRLDLFVR